MRILQIDDDVRKEIKRVKKYASDHVVSKYQQSLIKSNDALPVGDNPEHLVHIHDGYRVVYSIDQHPETGDWYHHLSISVEASDAYPNELAVNMVLEEFGMKKIVLHKINSNSTIWLEKEVEAVNVIQFKEKNEKGQRTKKDDS